VIGAILGWAELGCEPAICQTAKRFTRIDEQGERAAGLTRELLTLAQRQVLQPRMMDLNTVVTGLLTFLRRVIGKKREAKSARTASGRQQSRPDHHMLTADFPMASYLQKPYSSTHLGRRVPDVLDESKKAQPPG
jgi:hypothetical protein